jgi:hypothetical protein
MPDDHAPRVTLRFSHAGTLEIAVAKLVFEGSQPFAVPMDGAAATLPDGVRVLLDASQLEEVKDSEAEFPLFLYRSTVVLHDKERESPKEGRVTSSL